MASALKLGTAARNGATNGIVDRVDDGSGAGYVQVRTGSPPTNPADADSGTLLGTVVASDPAFGNSSVGVASASAFTSDSAADNSGTAGHWRLKDSDGNVVMQGAAGESGDTPDMVFDNKTIVAGGVIAITSFTYSTPAS